MQASKTHQTDPSPSDCSTPTPSSLRAPLSAIHNPCNGAIKLGLINLNPRVSDSSSACGPNLCLVGL